jgi:hypothetical protein
LFVGVEVGFVQDDAQHSFWQPDVRQQPQVTLLERVGIIEIFCADVVVELLQHLGRDVVVQRRGRIRQQQPRPGRRRAHDDEELVVDVEQTENCSCAPDFAKFRLRGGQAVERGTAHGCAAPFAVLPDDGDAEPVRDFDGSVLRRGTLGSHVRLR